MLAGNQIPFGGTRLGFVQVSIMEGSLLLLQTPTQNQVLFSRREFDFQLTQVQFQPNLQLGSSNGGLSKSFHGVGIGPLSKILAINIILLDTILVITLLSKATKRSSMVSKAFPHFSFFFAKQNKSMNGHFYFCKERKEAFMNFCANTVSI